MANPKIIEQKAKAAQDLCDKMKESASIVLVDYIGINVADDTQLRAELRNEGVEYAVVKNSILEHAFEDAGYPNMKEYLHGSTAVAMGSDPIAPERVLKKYSDKFGKKMFNFKGGIVDGSIVSVDQLLELAALPSRDGLISVLAGTLNGLISGLARGISEVAKQKEAQQ